MSSDEKPMTLLEAAKAEDQVIKAAVPGFVAGDIVNHPEYGRARIMDWQVLANGKWQVTLETLDKGEDDEPQRHDG